LRAIDIITKKRDGLTLTSEEIHFIIDGYVKGDIPDYQMSALLMAIYFIGLDKEEQKKVISQLTSTGKIIVDISLDQVSHFAGNMLEVKSRNGNPLMVMSASAHNALTAEQENIISTYNKIISADLETIEKNGGGSARCMLAEIFY